MKVVFMGTPDFAVPSLETLLKDDSIQVLAVVTQPDKPVGRKKTLTAPPVKVCSEKYHILVLQPEKISKDLIAVETLKLLKPDVIITVAYGQILKENILDLAPHGVINLHSSLLPDYRGPAPMNWMIINGEEEVGVTTMDTVLEIDAGDILLQEKSKLGENETTEELAKRLSKSGARLLQKTIKELKNLKPLKQKYPKDYPEHKKLAPFMDKKLGEIEFQRAEFTLGSANPRQSDFKITKKNSAQNIHNLVRGTFPWPGAYFTHEDKVIKVLESRVHKENSELKPGQITEIKEDSFCVQTHDGLLEVLKVKPAGKKEMTGQAWVNGAHLKVKDLIS